MIDGAHCWHIKCWCVHNNNDDDDNDDDDGDDKFYFAFKKCHINI